MKLLIGVQGMVLTGVGQDGQAAAGLARDCNTWVVGVGVGVVCIGYTLRLSGGSQFVAKMGDFGR